MKALFGFVLVAVSLTAQTSGGPAASTAIRRLNSTLLTLAGGVSRDAAGRQLAADIAAVADPDHRPAAKLVKAFAEELAAALPAGDLRAVQLSLATAPIIEVLHSAGTSTVGFIETVAREEKALTALGVSATQARSIAERLMAIGKQVRGPEGVPLHGGVS